MIADVFMERRWQEPLSVVGMQAILEAADACLGIHRVHWQGSLLSADGRVMFCHFRSPDTESVRIAMRQWRSAPGVIWPCQITDAPDAEADLYRVNVAVCQRFESPASFDARLRLDGDPSDHSETRHARFLRSYLSCDGLRMISLYHSHEADSLSSRANGGGSPTNQVWKVRRYAP